MIRWARTQVPLFYDSASLHRSSGRSFYDRLARLNLDWEDLARPLHGAFSKKTGRPTDPAVYLKAFLVAYFENIECDTELADRLSDSLSIRRFLFGSLEGSPPDHSSLGRVRKAVSRWCEVEEVLSRIVREMDRAGLIGDEAVALDTTLVPSRARRPNWSGEERSGEEEEAPPPRCAYDPDAQMASKPGYRARHSHKISVAVDYKKRAIVSARALPASSGESACARVSVTDTVRRRGRCPSYVVADAGMDDSAFHAHVEFYSGTPVTAFQKKNGAKASGFGKESFRYEPGRDVYRCVGGRSLKRVSAQDASRLLYRADLCVCRSCPFFGPCYGKAKRAKTVSRSFDEASRERTWRSRKDPVRRRLLAYRKGKGP